MQFLGRFSSWKESAPGSIYSSGVSAKVGLKIHHFQLRFYFPCVFDQGDFPRLGGFVDAVATLVESGIFRHAG